MTKLPEIVAAERIDRLECQLAKARIDLKVAGGIENASRHKDYELNRMRERHLEICELYQKRVDEVEEQRNAAWMLGCDVLDASVKLAREVAKLERYADTDTADVLRFANEAAEHAGRRVEAERQLKAMRIPCPIHREEQCPGKLALAGHRTTDMGYNGIDRNSVTQHYICGTCGVKVQRSWTWEPNDE